jgi:hypothetical protein
MAFGDVVAAITGGMAGLGTLAKDIRTAITGKEPISQEKAAELALKAQELEAKMVEMENSLALGQMDINKVEAANPSKFVSGWRPMVGWVGAIGLALASWPRAILGMTFWAIACVKAQGLVPMPDIGIDTLIALLGSLLGFGGMRTYERKQGIARL